MGILLKVLQRKAVIISENVMCFFILFDYDIVQTGDNWELQGVVSALS
jgi:hypothetical protein